MKAIILAGGGDNLPPFTSTRPKPMVHFSGRYLLDSVIEYLRVAGIADLILVVDHRRERIVSRFGGGDGFGVRISYLDHEEGAPGIGNALLRAEGQIHPDEHFLLVYGDVVTIRNIYLETLRIFYSFRTPVAAICLTPSAEALGDVRPADGMRIMRPAGKPMRAGMGNYILAGVFVLSKAFFDLLKSSQSNMQWALETLIGEEGLYSCVWEQEWVDIKFPWDILRANRMVMGTWRDAVVSPSAEIQSGVRMDGSVHIEEGVRILSGTIIEGPCYLGKGSFVGNNVLIRPYTSFGPGSAAGNGVELKNCVVSGSARIGRFSFIGDSVVGEGVNVGPRTVTANANLDGTMVRVPLGGGPVETGMPKLGSFIGDDVVIGAGHTLLAGTVIRSGRVIPHNVTLPLEV